jgi:hypothetical protein
MSGHLEHHVAAKPAPGAPVPDRPHIPGYGIPEHGEGLLPWSHAGTRLQTARNYWVATTRPDGRPHAVPVWGVFVEGAVYFDGGPHTRHNRNLAGNPHVVVHLESGDDVVIVEGIVEQVTPAPDSELAGTLAAAYAAKYAPDYQPPADSWKDGGLYRVRPTVAFAWTSFPEDTTRWRFPGG